MRSRGVLLLGSDPFRADMVVRDAQVSPKRTKFYRKSGSRYLIGNLGGSDGTAVNDEFLEGERPLSDGDRIALGDSVLRVLPRGPCEDRLPRCLACLISRDHLTHTRTILPGSPKKTSLRSPRRSGPSRGAARLRARRRLAAPDPLPLFRRRGPYSKTARPAQLSSCRRRGPLPSQPSGRKQRLRVSNRAAGGGSRPSFLFDAREPNI